MSDALFRMIKERFASAEASGSDTPCFWHYFRRDEVIALCEAAGFTVRVCALAADLGQQGWDTIWVCVCEKRSDGWNAICRTGWGRSDAG